MTEQSNLSEFTETEGDTEMHECRVCGRLFDSPQGRGIHWTQSHSDNEIEQAMINGLQELADELGRTPSARDMEQEGSYSRGRYEKVFDSWNNALREANLEIHKKMNITKSNLNRELLRLADELGRTPSYNDMTQHGEYGTSTYERVFDSWNDALREVGLEVNEKGLEERKIAKSTLCNELVRLADELGQTPIREDVRRHSEYSYSVYERRFGSWNNALREAGLEPRREKNIPKSTLRDEIVRLADELERTPSYNDMDQKGKYSAGTYERKFNSWSEALRQSGYEPIQEHKISREDLENELNDLAEQLGRTPAKSDMKRNECFSADAYIREFGSWSDALKQLGYEPVQQHTIPREDLKDELDRLAEQLSHSPTSSDMRKNGEFSTDAYVAEFGSWNGALEQLGFETNTTVHYPDHLDHKVRSTYETEMAEILLDEKVEYDYEGLEIEYGNNRIYTPDFVTSQYVFEIKGYSRMPGDGKKAEIAIEQLDNKQYVVIQDDGPKLPADVHISWEDREQVRQLFNN